MTKLIHKIRQALTRDSETVPLANFGTVSSAVTVHGHKRLAALGEVLEASPQTRGATQLYLTLFISKAQRQVGASQSLFTTFAERVSKIPESTLEAMPAHTRAALTRLAEVARKTPIPCPDAMLVAHGLTIDGDFCRLVAELSGEPEKQPETPAAAFRRLSSKHHPDKGGSAETQAALNELWKSVRQEQR